MNFGAGNTPRAVELARNDPHEDREEDLNKHADTNYDEDLGVVFKSAEAVDQALGGSLRLDFKEFMAILGIFLLELCNVKEASV